MAEDVTSYDMSGLVRELDGALANLDAALAQTSHSISVIRNSIAQIATLAEAVREMEAAITLARQNLSLPLGTTRQAVFSPSPRLRPVPPREPMPEPSSPYRQEMAGRPMSEPSYSYQQEMAGRPISQSSYSYRQEMAAGPVPPPAQPEPAFREAAPQPPAHQVAWGPPAQEAPAAEPAAAPSPPRPSRPISHCLRLGVHSRVGSLDLKAVDGAVNENPAVVDVALLDYDGRQATLKLWINGSADPIGVGEALLGSLRRRLGDEREADVRIEFEESAA